jgi:hypothetical protein
MPWVIYLGPPFISVFTSNGMELLDLAKFKFSTLMFVKIEIPFHEFTYFAYICMSEMEMKQDTLDPEMEFSDFL